MFFQATAKQFEIKIYTIMQQASYMFRPLTCFGFVHVSASYMFRPLTCFGLLHVSASFGHYQGGVLQRKIKIQHWTPFLTAMYQLYTMFAKSTHLRLIIGFDIHDSVHHNTVLIKMPDKIQLCRIIYYSIVPWLLCMF